MTTENIYTSSHCTRMTTGIHRSVSTYHQGPYSWQNIFTPRFS